MLGTGAVSGAIVLVLSSPNIKGPDTDMQALSFVRDSKSDMIDFTSSRLVAICMRRDVM